MQRNEHPVKQNQGEVVYAGGVAGSVAGLLQVNVRVPANAVGLAYPLAFTNYGGIRPEYPRPVRFRAAIRQYFL